MRVFLAALVTCGVMTGLAAQPAGPGVVGTWTGTAGCRHGGGEAITLEITRDAEGKFHGATDWARSSSDGRRGPTVPFTAVTVDGSTIKASTTANGRTIRMEATVDGDTITGRWLTDGDDDPWTFKGTRDKSRAAAPRG